MLLLSGPPAPGSPAFGSPVFGSLAGSLWAAHWHGHRGGVLTMASVLKVTANGTTTSPVTRGVWVMERILGTPPPKPPVTPR